MSVPKVCRCGHQQVMHRAQVGCMAAHPSDETACCPCPAFEDDQMLSRAELLAELKALPRRKFTGVSGEHELTVSARSLDALIARAEGGSDAD